MRDGSLEYYKHLYETMQLSTDKADSVKVDALILLGSKDIYQKVAKKANTSWEFVGLIHMMECGFGFQRGLHNGEPWDMKTTLVPKGRGPFESWEDSACDALTMNHISLPKGNSDSEISEIAMALEKYNGRGYMRRNVHSPYLWSFSNHGEGVGKYIADGHYDPDAVSDQPGAMVVLGYLRHFEDHLLEIIEQTERGIPFLKYNSGQSDQNVRSLQVFINSLLDFSKPEVIVPWLKERLKLDGKAGPKTSNMCKAVFGHRLKGDPRGD